MRNILFAFAIISGTLFAGSAFADVFCPDDNCGFSSPDTQWGNNGNNGNNFNNNRRWSNGNNSDNNGVFCPDDNCGFSSSDSQWGNNGNGNGGGGNGHWKKGNGRPQSGGGHRKFWNKGKHHGDRSDNSGNVILGFVTGVTVGVAIPLIQQGLQSFDEQRQVENGFDPYDCPN